VLEWGRRGPKLGRADEEGQSMTISCRHLSRGVLTLLALAACLLALPDAARAAPEERVTICHGTQSRTNPYNQISVAESSAVEGHASHTGPVFGPDVEDWGDIIPPIRPGLPRGLNWNAASSAVLDNGCEMEPDVGPEPRAAIADVECAGTTPAVVVTVGNAADATDPATFTIRVNGAPVQTVGPIAPGETESVTLTGSPEDHVAVIEVVSDGEVIDSAVETADCAPGPPAVAVRSSLDCADGAPEAALSVTNNGSAPITAVLQVDGTQVGQTVTIAPGATERRSVDAAQWEDQTVTARVLVDGAVVATYTVTPDCEAPVPQAAARVAGTVCPPPTATLTLSNAGDPASSVVFGIRVDDREVQRSAPLYGGDTTTIVVDLTRFEDRTMHVEAGYNGEVVVDRTVTVDCVDDDGDGGSGTDTGTDTGAEGVGAGGTDGTGGTAGGQTSEPGVLPSVGSDIPVGVVVLGAALLTGGAVLLLLGLRIGRPARR
jgi:hypothetical protein